MDIPREKQRSPKKYILSGLGIAAVVATTVGLSQLKPAAPGVVESQALTATLQGILFASSGSVALLAAVGETTPVRVSQASTRVRSRAASARTA